MNQSDWYAKLLEWSHKDSRLGRLPYVLMVVLAEHLAEHEAAEHSAHPTWGRLRNFLDGWLCPTRVTQTVRCLLMAKIVFKKSVLHVWKLPVPYWGVSAKYDDDIAFYLGKVGVCYYWATPNKACTRLLLVVRKIQSLVSVRKSG